MFVDSNVGVGAGFENSECMAVGEEDSQGAGRSMFKDIPRSRKTGSTSVRPGIAVH